MDDDQEQAEKASAPKQQQDWMSGPTWLYVEDEAVANARDQLLGDYNMWVQLAGGSRQQALDLFIQDYPKGPLKAGDDTHLKGYLGQKFPWLLLYRSYEYRTGIFNTVTFVVLAGILGYIALVYQPKPKPNPDAPGTVLVTPDDPPPAKK